TKTTSTSKFGQFHSLVRPAAHGLKSDAGCAKKPNETGRNWFARYYRGSFTLTTSIPIESTLLCWKTRLRKPDRARLPRALTSTSAGAIGGFFFCEKFGNANSKTWPKAGR